MAISTNGTVLARLAGALYNTQMSNATYSEVKTLDPSALANTLYARDFASMKDADVANTLVTNLGLSSITGLNNWVAAQLTAAGSANKGAKIVDLLNSFATMTTDTVYGSYAIAFNAAVDSSLALSQTTGNTGGAFSTAGVFNGTSFTLTSGVDAFVGTAANDTFNATGATWTSLDALSGGSGTDTLNIVDTTGALTAGAPASATTSSIETINISSTGSVGAVAGASAVKQVNQINLPAVKAVSAAAVAQTNEYTMPAVSAPIVSTDTVSFTYGGNAGTYTVGAASTNSAANFAAALNTVAGATVAVVGQSITSSALTGATTFVYSSATSGLAVGQSVSATGIPSNTRITAISADKKTITVSAALTADISGSVVYGGGASAVDIISPVAGTVLPSIAFTSASRTVDIPSQALTTANAAATYTTDPAVAGDVVSFTYGSVGGSYTVGTDAAGTATNLAGALNTAAGATVATVGQAVAASGLASGGGASGSTTLVYTSATSGLVVGQAVSGTGVASGTQITAISSDKKTITLSAALTAAASGNTTFGGGSGAVTVVAPTAGTALPTITFGGANGDLPTSQSTLTANAAAGASAATFDVSSTTSFSGLTALNVTASTADYLKVASTTDANITSSGAVTLSGGKSQTITSSGATSATGSVGAVVVTNNDTSTSATTVTGGTTVGVTQKGSGAVTVGSNTGTVNPSGAVTVTTTKAGSITAYGGTDLTLTTGGGAVVVGGTNSATTGTVNPTGAVTVTEKSYNGATAGAVTINGGNGVTVKTDGGLAGAAKAIAIGSYTSSTVNSTAKGAISVTNQDSTVGIADTVAVLGGTTVAVTTPASSGAVDIGYAAALNDAGTGLDAATLAKTPTGNVTIANGTSTQYGTSATTVYTNGATAVSVAGASTLTVADAQAKLATAGANVGKAVGTSTLAAVTLEGVTGTTGITSDALTTLNLKNISLAADKTITVTNATVGHSLALSLDNVKQQGTGTVYYTTVTDNVAAGATVSTAGTATDTIKLSGSKLTSVTFNNANTLTVAGLVMATPAAAVGTTAAVVDSITANNTGTLALGDRSGYADGSSGGKIASINASGGTGNVSVKIDSTATTFTGGAGNDTVTVTNAGASKAITGGAGTNTLIVDASSAAATNASAYITGFTVLGMGAAADGNFDATGYDNLLIANTIDNSNNTSAFTNVRANATLTQTANTASSSQKQVTITLADATGTADVFNLVLGVDGNSTTGKNIGVDASDPSVIRTDSVETVTIASKGVTNGSTVGVNYIKVLDDALRTITITGDNGLTLGAQTVSSATGVSTIDASGSTAGAINTTSVVLKTTGATITGGAGVLTAIGGVTTTANDVITVGSGGGVISAGIGGAAGSSSGFTSTWTAGSTTINLGNSVVRDTVVINNLQTNNHDVYSYFTKVNNFAVANSGTAGDAISFQAAGTAQSKAVLATSTSVTNAASGVQSYTIANGIITFTPIAANVPTLTQTITDAVAVVNAANSYVDAIGAFVYGGDTYIVSSGHTYTNSKSDSVDVTVLRGTVLNTLGNLAAAGSAVISSGVTYTAHTDTASFTNNAQTISLTGYNAETLTVTGTSGAVQATTETLTNLASSALVNVYAGTRGYHVGTIATTQTGAAGANNLTVNFSSSHSGIVDTLNVTGDWAVTLSNGDSGGPGVVTNLVDVASANTLTTVYVKGGYAVELDKVTSTALTTIDASLATGAVTLGTAATSAPGPIGNDGITVKASQAATTAYLSGAGDTVVLNSVAVPTVGGGTFNLTGANDTVNALAAGNLGAALTINASGAGVTIDLSKVSSTSSYGATIQGATSGSAVGSNATVKLGVGDSTYVQKVYAGVNTNVYVGGTYETVDVTNTAAAYGTTANMTTIQLGNDNTGTALTAYATGDTVKFNSTTTITNANVSQATSLAAALAIADIVAETAAAGSLAWFNYGGDTYVLQSNASTSLTAIDAADSVVKIVGIHGVANTSGVVTIS